MVFSIGYGGRRVLDVLSLLKKHHINYLLDVRSSPFSKFTPEFNGKNLTETLAREGIHYLFLGDSLGGKPEGRELYTNDQPDYKKISQSKRFREGLNRIVNAENLDLNIIILCAEKDPRKCHRSRLIGEELAKDNILIRHIDKNDKIVEHHKLNNNEQQSLF